MELKGRKATSKSPAGKRPRARARGSGTSSSAPSAVALPDAAPDVLVDTKPGNQGCLYLQVEASNSQQGRWVPADQLLAGGVGPKALASVPRGGSLYRQLVEISGEARGSAFWTAAEGWDVPALERALLDALQDRGCVCCRDALAAVSAQPCGHAVFCASCHALHGTDDLVACPVCRARCTSWTGL